MADNSKKQPFIRNMGAFTRAKISDAMQLTGKALPASVTAVQGSIVTVAFEITSLFTIPPVTIPLFGPVYVRYPIQKGDLGVVLPMDSFIGNVSGLGETTATLSQRANLTALVFLPIANTDWPTVDPNAVTVNGPNGVVLRDTNSNSVFTLTPTQIIIEAESEFMVTVGASSFEILPASISLTAANIYLNGNVGQAAGASAGTVTLLGPVTVVNELTADGVGVATHTHKDAGGSGNSGPPNNPS